MGREKEREKEREKKRELEKEKSLLALETKVEPRTLRVRDVKEAATEEKKEKSPTKAIPSPGRSLVTEAKELPRKKNALEAKSIKAQVKSDLDVKGTTAAKGEPKKEEKAKVKRELDYDLALNIKQEAGEEQKTSPIKTERRVSESPNKLPTYATMIKKALEDMNVVGGEGCTKLEILLYILRKFQPKGNVSVVASKMIKVLEEGTKHGDFLSSVSLPRKMIKKEKLQGKGDQQKETEKKNKTKEEGEKKKKKKDTGNNAKSKIKKAEKSKKGVKDNGGKTETERKDPVQYVYKLKEPLSTICKAKKMTRYEVLRKIWTYIRLKKLQDPKDKRMIICDEVLRKMTKQKEIDAKLVSGLLKPFMEKTTMKNNAS